MTIYLIGYALALFPFIIYSIFGSKEITLLKLFSYLIISVLSWLIVACWLVVLVVFIVNKLENIIIWRKRNEKCF